VVHLVVEGVEDKMTNFNLSKRIVILPDSNDFEDELKTAKVLMIKDVREFIEKLKANYRDLSLNEFIDKLAGKDLIRR